jgi:Holliday junction resolvase RusA-like endonuclease
MHLELPMRGFSKVRAQFTRKGNGAGGFTYMPATYRNRQWMAVEALRENIDFSKFNWPRIKKDFLVAPGKWFAEQGFIPVFNELLVVNILFEFNKSTRSDKDNLEGGILDAFNGILWSDDSIIKDGRTLVLEQSGHNKVTLEISKFDINHLNLSTFGK